MIAMQTSCQYYYDFALGGCDIGEYGPKSHPRARHTCKLHLQDTDRNWFVILEIGTLEVAIPGNRDCDIVRTTPILWLHVDMPITFSFFFRFKIRGASSKLIMSCFLQDLRTCRLGSEFWFGNVHFANHFFSTNNTAWSERKIDTSPIVLSNLLPKILKHGSFIPFVSQNRFAEFFTFPKYLLGLFSPKRGGFFRASKKDLEIV